MGNTSEGARKANDTARKRMGEKKYREMKGRAGKKSTPGYFGWLKENDPEKLDQIVKERDAKRKDRSRRYKKFLELKQEFEP